MKPLDEFVRDVAAPILQQRGYERSSRSFVLRSGSGDGVFVGFQPWRSGRNELEFFVNVAVFFAPVRAWFHRDESDPGRLTEAEGLWRSRLQVPGKDPVREDAHLWDFDRSDQATVQLFRTTLGGAVQAWERLADRAAMVDALRAHRLNLGELQCYPIEHAIALLLSDDIGSADLDNVLAQIGKDEGAESEFLTWLRKRATNGR